MNMSPVYFQLFAGINTSAAEDFMLSISCAAKPVQV